jgi:hypothetical protein
MGVIAGANINDNGLIFSLDAANFRSYSGSGLTSFGLVGGIGGTLVNGVGFTSSNSGSFIFDGTNDYIDTQTDFLSTRYTVSVWFMLHTQSANRFQIIFESGYAQIFLSSQSISFWYKNASPYWLPYDINLSFNTWYQVCVVNDANLKSVYLNGLFGSSVSDSSNYEPPNNVKIGSNQGTIEFLNGKVGQFFAYNRALTAKEIKQNYNATKKRYGL